MKRIGRKDWKRIAAVIIVIIFTIILFPRHTVWRQFQKPIDEGIWKRQRQNTIEVSYERKLTRSETKQVKSILNDTKLYDLRKVSFDRDGGVFDGELTVSGETYGVDLSSGLILSGRWIGWLSDEQISWLKLLCLKPAVPAESGG